MGIHLRVALRQCPLLRFSYGWVLNHLVQQCTARGVVDSSGARGSSVTELTPAIHAVISRHVSNQELIVESALTGSVTLARQALLNDPLVRLPPEAAVAMLDEMLAANSAYLPLFFG